MISHQQNKYKLKNVFELEMKKIEEMEGKRWGQEVEMVELGRERRELEKMLPGKVDVVSFEVKKKGEPLARLRVVSRHEARGLNM